MSDDERAIRELVAAWMAATKAGDHDRVLSLMTDDVVFMVPGREPFGREAFAAASNISEGQPKSGNPCPRLTAPYLAAASDMRSNTLVSICS